MPSGTDDLPDDGKTDPTRTDTGHASFDVDFSDGTVTVADDMETTDLEAVLNLISNDPKGRELASEIARCNYYATTDDIPAYHDCDYDPYDDIYTDEDGRLVVTRSFTHMFDPSDGEFLDGVDVQYVDGCYTYAEYEHHADEDSFYLTDDQIERLKRFFPDA